MLALAAPLAAVVFATIASSIFLLIAGSNPFTAYGDMFEYGSRLEIQVDILNRATPLYISGVAAAIGFRMNLFNICLLYTSPSPRDKAWDRMPYSA